MRPENTILGRYRKLNINMYFTHQNMAELVKTYTDNIKNYRAIFDVIITYLNLTGIATIYNNTSDTIEFKIGYSPMYILCITGNTITLYYGIKSNPTKKNVENISELIDYYMGWYNPNNPKVPKIDRILGHRSKK